MSSYDSKRFSKLFSERTLANYQYIYNSVYRNKLEREAQSKFLAEYEKLIDEVNSIKDTLRNEANQMPNIQKRGKNEVKKQLHAIASSLERDGKRLHSEMEKLVSTEVLDGAALYEVTQLLNSLMGIAVLPYEMHKEYFQRVDEERQSEANRGNGYQENQDSVKSCPEYKALLAYIMQLHEDDKWKSTYKRDLQDDHVNENNIVFRFLRHMRNVTCHSGDDAISILPLDDGQVITDVMFYDKFESKDDTANPKVEEFAMWLSVSELKDLVFKISEFYSNSEIGNVDRTANIEKAEARVRELLGDRAPRKR